MLVQFPGGTVIHTGPSFIQSMPTKEQGVTTVNANCIISSTDINLLQEYIHKNSCDYLLYTNSW